MEIIPSLSGHRQVSYNGVSNEWKREGGRFSHDCFLLILHNLLQASWGMYTRCELFNFMDWKITLQMFSLSYCCCCLAPKGQGFYMKSIFPTCQCFWHFPENCSFHYQFHSSAKAIAWNLWLLPFIHPSSSINWKLSLYIMWCFCGDIMEVQ